MNGIPKVGDNVELIEDDYYSQCKKGSKGVVTGVSLWYWRADIVFNDGTKANVHFDNIELIDN